jgi:hypothetical protein
MGGGRRRRTGAGRIAAVGPLLASLLVPGVIAGAILRTCGPPSDPWTQDWRYPCDGTRGWDPNQPLYIHWYGWPSAAADGGIDLDAPGFREHVRLLGLHDDEVPLWLSERQDGLIVYCPKQGLEPDTAYRWVVDELERSSYHLPSPAHDEAGWFRLETGGPSTTPSIGSQVDCDAHTVPEALLLAAERDCHPCETGSGACSRWGDTGETGDPDADSGGDSAADSSRDSGDSTPDSGGDSCPADDTADSGGEQAP